MKVIDKLKLDQATRMQMLQVELLQMMKDHHDKYDDADDQAATFHSVDKLR